MEATGIPELDFPGGLPGFPASRRFALVEWGGESSPFSVLRDLDDETVQFVVVHPSVFFPDYEPELADDATEALDLEDPDDAVVLVILTLGDSPEAATANLLGPVVINRRTRVGAQVVAGGGEWGTAEPIAAAARS